MSSTNPVIEYRIFNDNVKYGTCLTIGHLPEKSVKCENFILQSGSEVIVRFDFTNKSENPTLNVNDTGAKPIYYRGAAVSPSIIAATRTYLFVYNGSQYELVGDVSNIYKDATMTDSGLISAEEKYKLFTVEYNANYYTHPVGTGNRHIPSGGKEGQVLRWADDGFAVWAEDLNTEYSDVTDTESGLMSPEYKKKLDGIENNANKYILPEAGTDLGGVKSGGDVTINNGVIEIKDNSHSHTTSTITDLENVLSNYVKNSEKGSINGIATLGEDGKLLANQIPGSVDEILEFAGIDNFPAIGETGKLYVDTISNKTYRWSGSQYSIVSDSIALGETATTAYRGDFGKVAYDHSQSTGNPHATKYNELKNIPETFTPKAHYHKSNEINSLTNYTKAEEYTSIEKTDSLNKALGKLEKGLELKPDTDTTYEEATTSTAGLMSAEDKLKLDGIDEFANNYTYTLYKATNNELGGIRIGYSENNKNYPVELDENGKAFVNVPWADNNTTYEEATQSTTGLMSISDKKKLDGIDIEANNYKLPTAGEEVLGGIKTGYTQIEKNYPLQLDENNKAFVNVPWIDTNTTYNVATSTVAGLMSAEDRIKLDGIAENANNYTYTLPTAGEALGGIKIGYEENGKNYPIELSDGKAFVNVPWIDTTYGEATTSTSGLLSYEDKTKLDGIAENANNYVLDKATSTALGGIRIGYTQSGKNYPVILNSSNQAYVNVPWTDNDTTYENATTSKAGLMSTDDKSKLDGIATNANNYTLPVTTSDALGGVKIGYTQSGKNYPVQLDSNNKAFVNVPWTDNDTYLSARTDDVSQVAVGVSNGTTLLYGEIADRQLNAVDTSNSTADLAVNDSIKLALKKLQNKIAEVNSIAAAGMRLKGEVSAPITTSAKIGDTYKATAKFTIAAANSSTGSSVVVNIGDTIVASAETPLWFVIPSGDEILNVATSETLGGVKIGYTQSGKNYPVQIDSNNKAYVNVPWTDNNTIYSEATTSISGLMSASDKSKLNGIAPNANNYTLPVTTSDILGGVKIGYSQNDKNYPVQLDSNNKAYVNVPWTDNNTIYSEATTSASGLMSASDKSKLNGISANANNYILPTSTADALGGVKIGYSQNGKNYPVQLDANSKAFVNVPWADNNTTYHEATTTTSGLMSASDKSKLNGIAANANNYSLPTSTADVLGGIKIGYTQSGKNYPVVLDSNGKAYVNVPWEDTNTTYTLSSFGITATAAQLNYTSGVTSNIQTQLNAKQAKHVTRIVTLSSSSWSNKSQTVSVSGVTTSNTIIVGPDPAYVDAYGNAGIVCTAQASNSLTFTCNIVPTTNITVNVIILN